MYFCTLNIYSNNTYTYDSIILTVSNVANCMIYSSKEYLLLKWHGLGIILTIIIYSIGDHYCNNLIASIRWTHNKTISYYIRRYVFCVTLCHLYLVISFL